MCMMHRPALVLTTNSNAAGSEKARTSLMISAPADTASIMTTGELVSTETQTSKVSFITLITGITRRSSSSTATGEDPGRVDSPPTSITSAPSATRDSALRSAFLASTAKSDDPDFPRLDPSEKEHSEFPYRLDRINLTLSSLH